MEVYEASRTLMSIFVQQVRNENDASPTSNLRSTHLLDPEPVDDQLDDLDSLLSHNDSEYGATDYHHDSFRVRTTGSRAPQCSLNTASLRNTGSAIPQPSTPISAPERSLSSTPSRSSTASARPRPAPIDVEKANDSKNQVVDEYEWSPRVNRPKSFMLRNKCGMARFRNEAFPPLDGARLEGMPVLTQVPTPYHKPNGEVGVFQQWRWVQPTTVLDQERYDAAMKKREEEWREKCRKKAYEDILELGRDKCEKLKGQMHTCFAQVAKDNGQQHT